VPTKLYDVAGATGLISVLGVWVLLHYFRIGGAPVFLLSALGTICSQIFVMRQAALQRRFNEFGSFGNMLMGCSWWLVAMLSVPIALWKYFAVVAGVR
jgi:hypothetical protein